ncbi:PREDICTED: glycerophosphodiester phosphodiesterase 1 [Ceratosolen solmsi marchali]|uniref:Glycerophosphodiester phosphodiesterase 1 n=1 Tax=Ceratosolen solmsi marchali TaxID=326594 RepID=A0AAJ6YUE0_9HYME|nr:PREDICTED: glycerophosphodiester phosphodiesterase 1 [Ceratosolen solmsi marchali]
MWNCIELIIASSLIWLYLQTACVFLINCIYLTVPWFIWGIIALYLFIMFGARVPPPNIDVVNKVLGIDPIKLNEKYNDNDEEYSMKVVAHRGAGYDYPENSLSAYRYCYQKGCDGIEIDLNLTKDNIAIVFHDSTIDRLTGISGYIRDMTWSELKDYDISANHPLRSKLFPEGAKIALFDEVLKEFLQNDKRMFIDIKVHTNEIIETVLNAFKKHPQLYEKAVISTFNPITVYTIRKRDPGIVAGIAWRPRIFSMNNYNGIDGPYKPRYNNLFKQIGAVIVDIIHKWALENVTYYILGLSFLLLHKDVISLECIRQWNNRGIRIVAWTVNLPTEKIHFAKNLKVTYLTDTLLS